MEGSWKEHLCRKWGKWIYLTGVHRKTSEEIFSTDIRGKASDVRLANKPSLSFKHLYKSKSQEEV